VDLRGKSRGRGTSELSAADLAALLGTEKEPFVLDVRQPEEVESWAIPGVVNVPLGDLPARLSELPTDRQVVVVCASGNRSSRATRLLALAGYHAVNLTGGMGAWGQVYDTAVCELSVGRIVQVRRRGKGCLSYLVGAGDESFVVDPSVQVELYTSLAEQMGWRITRVFDTHLHADHLSGARELARRCGASLHLSPYDSFDFDYRPLREDERFPLPGGLDVSVAVLHTPGHTQGSVVFVVGDEAVLSGDTLFVDGVGRPDLAERAEEFAANLHRSLQEKVLGLPDETTVLPAHYGDATPVVPGTPVAASLGSLRGLLPQLSYDEATFVSWATSKLAERPPNYIEIIKANMGRATITSEALASLEAGPNRCSV
jgi:glyoxylase-like metal-dependent hydrolase (beta-lactamase superfamily II)/rhodanese-related sulfurtransferase